MIIWRIDFSETSGSEYIKNLHKTFGFHPADLVEEKHPGLNNTWRESSSQEEGKHRHLSDGHEDSAC